MYTVDPQTTRPQEKTGGVAAPRAPASTIPLIAVMGVVVIILAAVVALSLLVGSPTHEAHDSWMNVPVFSVTSGVHDSWIMTGVVPTFEIHDSWMTTGN